VVPWFYGGLSPFILNPAVERICAA
jgi:hypothetical protein